MLRPHPLFRRGGRLGIAARFAAHPRPRALTAASVYSPPATIAVPIAHPVASTGGVIPRTLADAAAERRVRLIVDVVNRIMIGQLNCTLAVTLAANAASTTLVDARIGVSSAILFCPLSANASAEMGNGTIYVASQSNETATIAHANNSQTDRRFMMVILG